MSACLIAEGTYSTYTMAKVPQPQASNSKIFTKTVSEPFTFENRSTGHAPEVNLLWLFRSTQTCPLGQSRPWHCDDVMARQYATSVVSLWPNGPVEPMGKKPSTEKEAMAGSS